MRIEQIEQAVAFIDSLADNKYPVDMIMIIEENRVSLRGILDKAENEVRAITEEYCKDGEYKDEKSMSAAQEKMAAVLERDVEVPLRGIPADLIRKCDEPGYTKFSRNMLMNFKKIFG